MSEKEESALEESKEPITGTGDRADLDNLEISSTTTSNSDSVDSLVKRRSRFVSSWAALQYIASISRDNYVRLRVSDRVTSVALLLAAILAVLSIVFHPLAKVRLPLAIVCDSLVGVLILLYLLNRLGILIVLSPREALLTWQLIVVSCVFGIFLTLNIGLIIAIIVLNPTFFTSY